MTLPTPATARARRASTGRLAAAALVAAALATAGHAAAQTPPPPAPAAAVAARPLAEVLTGPAKAEYEAGRILFRDGDHANAIIKFEHAYELSREPRLLWNVALCQKNLKRYTRMLATVQKLLDDAGPLLSAQDRKDAAELIDTIQAFVSRLQLTVSEDGAAIFVDDQQVGTTPLRAPVLLDVGARKIRASKKGFKDATVVREITGGDAVALSLTLAREIHRGRLAVSAGPEDMIAIDGKIVGRARWEGPVPSGGHTLRVTAPGMKTHQAEVMIVDDQARHFQVTLTPQPKSGEVERWLWIGGGAALLAGAIVGAAFLYQPESPVDGNAAPGSIQIASHGAARGPALAFPFGASR